MLKIFHAPGSRSMRIVWLCEEMGVPYEALRADMRNPSPEFRAASPLGATPAMIDGEGPPMIESVAMMLYISEKYGPTDLTLKPNEREFGRYLQFLVFPETAIGGEINTIFGARFMAPAEHKANWSADRCVLRMEKAFDLIAKDLEGRDTIAGGRFTMADICIAHGAGVVTQYMGYGDKLPPVLLDYHKRMTTRPAYQRAAAVK
jgi:glutathione S-transferase